MKIVAAIANIDWIYYPSAFLFNGKLGYKTQEHAHWEYVRITQTDQFPPKPHPKLAEPAHHPSPYQQPEQP